MLLNSSESASSMVEKTSVNNNHTLPPSSSAAAAHAKGSTTLKNGKASSNRTSPSDVMMDRPHSFAATSTTTTASDSSNNTTVVTLQPFFIMDMLNQVDPKALELAQKMLRLPPKNKILTSKSAPSLTTVGGGNDLFQTTAPSRFKQRSITIGNAYNAKGIQKARQGEWGEALACWENALEVRTQILGELHIDVANTHNNIGIAYGKLDRVQEAAASLRSALEIRQSHYGHHHTEVAATLHNLGNVYQQDGDYETAIQYFCECKILQEEIFGGTDHVEVARACVAIGHTYYQAEAIGDAREAYMDALTIFHRVGLVAEDPEVQATVEDIKDLNTTARLVSSLVPSNDTNNSKHDSWN